MKLLIALKTSSLYNRLLHECLLLAFGIILLYLTFVRPWTALVLITYVGYLFHKNYALKKVMLFLIIIYGVILGLKYFQTSRLEDGMYEGKAKVSMVVLKEDYAKIILEINKEKVSWITEDMTLKCGMRLQVKGILLDPEGAHVPHGYDERKSLKYQEIYHKIRMESYEVLATAWTVYRINELCNEYYDKTFPPRVSSYLKALVLGNKNDLDQEDMTGISILGISHLFVVSGLHINLLILIVGKLLSFIRVPEKYHSPLIIIFLTGYLVATAFLIAVVRVFVGEMLKLVNKKYRLGFDSLDLLSVNFLFVCLIMPLVPYQYAFILTYITTFSITVARNIFSQYQNYFVQSLAISIVSFFITLPIIINISYRVNFLSILYNLFYIPLVSFIILPLSMIITFIPYLSFLYEILITGFSNSLTILSGIDLLIISFPAPSLVFFIIYYALLLLIFSKWENKKMNWKTAGVMVLLLIIYKNVRYFNPSDQVVFFDLKEGEATFIGQSFNRCNILIDTGETDNSDLLRYLDAEGITTIHYLIISHGDSDHSGQAVEILKNYYVHNLIYGAYDNSENIEEILRKVGKTRAETLKAGDVLSCGKDIRFQIISPVEDYDNVNKNSLVMEAEIFGIRYLFTGDIDNQVEKVIAKKSRIQVDILKVAHHGSITSSSEAFLKNTGYKMAIIMSGSRNTFGFPSKTVVERFKGKNLFMTKDHYSIILHKNWWEKMFKIKNTVDNTIVILVH